MLLVVALFWILVLTSVVFFLLQIEKDTKIKQLQEQAQKRDEVLSKRARFLQQQEEVNRKIRELGVPPAGFEKYKNTSLKDVSWHTLLLLLFFLPFTPSPVTNNVCVFSRLGSS